MHRLIPCNCAVCPKISILWRACTALCSAPPFMCCYSVRPNINTHPPPPGNCHVTSWRVQARVTTLGVTCWRVRARGDSFPRVKTKNFPVRPKKTLLRGGYPNFWPKIGQIGIFVPFPSHFSTKISQFSQISHTKLTFLG